MHHMIPAKHAACPLSLVTQNPDPKAHSFKPLAHTERKSYMSAFFNKKIPQLPAERLTTCKLIITRGYRKIMNSGNAKQTRENATEIPSLCDADCVLQHSLSSNRVKDARAALST